MKPIALAAGFVALTRLPWVPALLIFVLACLVLLALDRHRGNSRRERVRRFEEQGVVEREHIRHDREWHEALRCLGGVLR